MNGAGQPLESTLFRFPSKVKRSVLVAMMACLCRGLLRATKWRNTCHRQANILMILLSPYAPPYSQLPTKDCTWRRSSIKDRIHSAAPRIPIFRLSNEAPYKRLWGFGILVFVFCKYRFLVVYVTGDTIACWSIKYGVIWWRRQKVVERAKIYFDIRLSILIHIHKINPICNARS